MTDNYEDLDSLREQQSIRRTNMANMSDMQRPAAPAGSPLPSVGRIVHYYAYGSPGGEYAAGVARAAVITEVDTLGNPESPVGLCVLNPTGVFFNQHVRFGMGPGHWNWPPYVSPQTVQINTGYQQPPAVGYPKDKP